MLAECVTVSGLGILPPSLVCAVALEVDLTGWLRPENDQTTKKAYELWSRKTNISELITGVDKYR